MSDEGRFGEMEALLARSAPPNMLAQLYGGVVMSQGEIARAHELGVSEKDRTAFLTANVRDLISGTRLPPRPRHGADPRLAGRRGLMAIPASTRPSSHARADARFAEVKSCRMPTTGT